MKEYIVPIHDDTNRLTCVSFRELRRGYRELIRCKDCMHWDGYYCHNKWWGDGYGNYAQPIKAGDGFCDWAERKEE